MAEQPTNPGQEDLLIAIQKLNRLVLILLLVIMAMPLVFTYHEAITGWFEPVPPQALPEKAVDEPAPDPDSGLWKAPDAEALAPGEQKDLVLYGQDLIAHTSRFLGPNGTVASVSNGMNCQNCHLDAGTRPYGNNYGSVASTYPKFRARSGSEEDIFKRVNDCFERSLNGKPLSTDSREMKAIRAYIEYLGSNVPRGEQAPGSGLKEMTFLDRAADPAKGKAVYEAKCQSCHQAGGEGMMRPDGSEYIYPPLWGEHSYNDAAGLFRMSNFARFVKYNMPLGASHFSAQLSDEESWDVAAYVNTQPRPHKSFPGDWPDITRKPVDHPFGPYADSFSEAQHKFGPYPPIQEFYSGKK
jgi:thiosulfate dehydrogenase